MSTEQYLPEDQGTGFLANLPTVLWRRKWLFIIPVVLALVAGIAVAWLMKPVYESYATVLIESQDLPLDLVNSPVTDVIDQRIARARQRVLSRMELVRLIRTYQLYPSEQGKLPLSKIVDRMRDDTSIAALDADVQSTRRGGGSSTIALRIGFKYEDPLHAQAVAQQYVNHFLEVDAAAQSEQAAGAAVFLTEQANALQARIADVEGQIMRIKEQNGPVLALAQQSTGDPSADAARIDSDIASLQVQNAKIVQAAETPSDNAVANAEAALRVMQAKYSDQHPDVVAAKAQLDAARRAAAAAPGGQSITNAELAANRSQIAALRTAKSMLLSQSSSTRAAQSRAPAVAGQVDQLEKQADALRDQYRVLSGKLQSAQIGARMQAEQKGERLTLSDPPIVPDRPLQPNRPLIVAAALAAGIGLGLALVLLVELLVRPIRGTAALTAAIDSPLMAIIPDFDRKPNFVIRYVEQRTKRRLARIAAPGS